MSPIRRARERQYDPQGANNPNIDGQDNSMNAWLDAQLNTESFDEEEISQVRYAKRNSDNNRFYNTDDAPIRGPRASDRATLNEHTRDIAYELAENNNINICSRTGVRSMEQLRRDDRPPHRRNLVVEPREPAYIREEPAPRVRSTVTQVNRNRRRAEPEPRSVPSEMPVISQQDYLSDQYDEIDQYYQNQQRENNTGSPYQGISGRMHVSDTSELAQQEYNMSSPDRYYRSHSPHPYSTQRNASRGRETERRTEQPQHLSAYKRGFRDAQQAIHRQNRNAQPMEQQIRQPSSNVGQRQRSGQCYDSSSSSDSNIRRSHMRKLKSGINAKPTSGVQDQLRYPHYSLRQLPGFIGLYVDFHQLSYDQLIVGEMATINGLINSQERIGRMRLLHE